jgi:hypothetical protein
MQNKNDTSPNKKLAAEQRSKLVTDNLLFCIQGARARPVKDQLSQTNRSPQQLKKQNP